MARCHAKVDVLFHKLFFETLRLIGRGFPLVLAQEGGLCLGSVLAPLTKIDRVSWLANDVGFLNLALIPLILSNLVVSLILSRNRRSCVAILETKVVSLHAIALLSVLSSRAFQRSERRCLIHNGRVSLGRSVMTTKGKMRRAQICRLFSDLRTDLCVSLIGIARGTN